MLIDPHAWMLTLPLMSAMIWFGREPSHSAARRLWDDVSRFEMDSLSFLGFSRDELGMRYAQLQRAAYVLIIAATGLASIASILAAVGLLPAAL